MSAACRLIARMVIAVPALGLSTLADACDAVTAHQSDAEKVRLAFDQAEAIVEALVEDDRQVPPVDSAGSASPPLRATVLRSWKGPFGVGAAVPVVTVLSDCSIAPIDPPVRMIVFLDAGRKSTAQGRPPRYVIEYGILKPDLIERDPRFAATSAELDRLAVAR